MWQYHLTYRESLSLIGFDKNLHSFRLCQVLCNLDFMLEVSLFRHVLLVSSNSWKKKNENKSTCGITIVKLNCGYQKVPLKLTDLYEGMNIKRNHYENAVIAFQKICSPILLHMIHYIFAFLSHNLGPNSKSGDKHPVIELSILELSTRFYYKIYIRISLLNVTSRLPILGKFPPAKKKKPCMFIN